MAVTTLPSFEAFYAASVPVVRARLFQHTHSHEQVEELTQEVFLKVVRAWSRINPSRNLTSWVLVIADNTARDAYDYAHAKKRNGECLSLDVLMEQGESEMAEQESPFLAWEVGQEIRRCLRFLPTLDLCLLLWVAQGQTPQQVAALGGWSECEIKKRLKRARLTFFEHYHQEVQA